MQGAQLAELEVLYKEEQLLRKRYFNTIEGSKHFPYTSVTLKFLVILTQILVIEFVSDMKGKIRVFCRLRPLGEKEIAEKDRDVLTSIDEFTVEHAWKDDKSKQHIYDRVFDGSATQEDVFEDTRVNLIEIK